VVILLTTEETVGAGTSKTFDVYMNMAAAASSDSVSSKLLGDDVVDFDDFLNVDERNFVWSDLSVVDHGDGTGSPASEDWASGWKVKTLPTDSQTLTK
jgi:hypothetical protein